jgi:hypothetical protein
VKLKRVADFILNSEMFAGIFAHPAASLLEWPVEFNSAGNRALGNAGPAIPALIGMQDDWALALFRVRNIDVYGTYFNAAVAPDTDRRIEDSRTAGCDYIRHGVDFFSFHFQLLLFDFNLHNLMW